MNKQNISFELDVKWFEQNKAKFIKAFNDSGPDKDDEGKRYRIDLDLEETNYELSKGMMALSFNEEEYKDSPKTWFWIEISLNTSRLIDLIELATKKLNRFKNMLETLESEEEADD